VDLKRKVCEDVDWSNGLGRGPVVGSCEYGNEPLGSPKDRKFLEQFSAYQLLKEDSAPCS
jgi:hypothetical protein